MSQATPTQELARETTSNGLGIAGFVVSLVGFLGGCFGGALLSPVGLVLSGVAMRRRPKGFAIAGLVLGILGSLWLVIALVLGTLVVGGLGLASFAVLSQIRIVERFEDVDRAIQDYKRDVGYLPIALSNLETQYPNRITPVLIKDMDYRATSLTSYTLILPGEDNKLGTADDVEHSVTLNDTPPFGTQKYSTRINGIEIGHGGPAEPDTPPSNDDGPK